MSVEQVVVVDLALPSRQVSGWCLAVYDNIVLIRFPLGTSACTADQRASAITAPRGLRLHVWRKCVELERPLGVETLPLRTLWTLWTLRTLWAYRANGGVKVSR